MKRFNVYLPVGKAPFKYQLIDTVYFLDCDAEYVKFSLVNHDNYSEDIIVEEA